MVIIDAHTHLWEKLSGDIHNTPVRHIGEGVVDFGGEKKQMMPPYMIDGKNSVEMLIANMNYSGVSGAVITQEYIDGIQNKYLIKVKEEYGDRLFTMGMAEFRGENYYTEVVKLIENGFLGIKVPAEKLVSKEKKIFLNTEKMLKTFKYMESKGVLLSIDLAEGDEQVKELEDVINCCPNLKIAIGHFGMVNRLKWKEQIKLALNKNVYIEAGGITWLFHKEFYPYSNAIDAILEAIDIVGEEKLMWGSDYPRTMTEITYKMSFDFILKSSKLSDGFKRKFLGENAKRFYSMNTLEKVNEVESILL